MEQDAELYARFARGDLEAFDVLVDRWKGPLVRFLHRFLGDRDRAEDMAQEVFVRLYTKAELYEARPGKSFKSYLFKIAANLAKNERRRLSRRILTVSMDRGEDGAVQEFPDTKTPTSEEMQTRAETVRAIQRGIGLLPHRQAAALVMSCFHDMSYKDIAETLGTSEKAVKSLVNRARDNLKNSLAKYLDS